MNQRNDNSRRDQAGSDFRLDEDLSGSPRAGGGSDQYGQDHASHRQHDQYQDPQQQFGQQRGQRPFGQRQSNTNDYGQSGYQAGRFERQEYERERGYRGGHDYNTARERDGQRGYSNFNQAPFSQQPSGHAPFVHSSFGESGQPRYFGTGAQGYGGGPSFTGGTYGTADERSDSPYFQEEGFNRGFQDEPQGHELERFARYGQPAPRNRGLAAQRSQQPLRRYPAGPKGYQRSDERLREDISERLMQSYDIDSSDVTVQVQGGKVVLEGTVPDRYMKHAIEDLADAAPGVQDVDNRIRVGAANTAVKK